MLTFFQFRSIKQVGNSVKIKNVLADSNSDSRLTLRYITKLLTVIETVTTFQMTSSFTLSAVEKIPKKICMYKKL